MTNPIEIQWAIKQLEALGHIQLSPDRVQMWLTGEGMRRAIDLMRTFRIDEMLLIYLLCGEVEKFGWGEK